MDYEEAKKQIDIVRVVEQYTKLEKSGKHYKGLCPFHNEKTASFIVYPDTQSWYCYGSCATGGDVISFIQKKENLPFKYAFEKLCIENGINYDISGNVQENNLQDARYKKELKKAEDYTSFFTEAHNHIDETTYHRGLNRETLDRFKIGYKHEWINPKAPKAPASPRLIIPISKGSYLARDTRSNAELTEQQQQFTKIKVGSQKEIFNGSSIKHASGCIFITEGELDALSIIQQGYNAVATGSTAYLNNLYETIKEINNRELVYYVYLDDDESGDRASEKLCEMLKQGGFMYDRLIFGRQYKDANDWLMNDSVSFASWLQEKASPENIENVRLNFETERDAAIDAGNDYKQRAAGYLAGYLLDQVMREANEPITTGYKSLDRLMDGGFYEGLYILGADTGTGKTTLIMQIAESIAKSGKDVLIIALEMSSRDLIARSVSRLTFEASRSSGKKENARTYRDILRARQLEKLDATQYDALADAIITYQTYADHIFIIEGIGDINADRVAEYTREHEKQTGNTPIVILDYLQILAPINTRFTDKQNIDASIVSLKRLSRDHHTPVICISSLNRETNKQNKEGKTDEIAKTGFKESGAIEYAADMIFALGKADADQPTQEEEEEGKPRIMSLKILKARSSRYNVAASFEYYPKYSYFKELEEKPIRSSFIR